MTQIDWHPLGTDGPWIVNPGCAQVESSEIGEDYELLPVCQLLWPTHWRTEAATYANAHAIAEVPAMVTAWREYFAAKEELAELERQSDTTKLFDAALQRKEAAELMALAALARIDQVQP